MDETLRKEVRLLTTRLGAIVQEQRGPKTFQAIETLRQLSKQIRQNGDPKLVQAKENTVRKLSLTRAEDVAHAFSLFFHLVNLCEERQRVRRLEAYERQDSGAPMSLRRTFSELARQAVSPARAARLIGSMRVEPVLTAHPTEAKRRSVFNHILRIGETLDSLDGDFGPAAERALDRWIEALWLTDEIRERPVTPEVEIESALVFLEGTIFDLAGNFWEEFSGEWQRFAPSRSAGLGPPFIGFGSWVGADRDGNPNVTPETSLEAAGRLRESILRYYRAACDRMLGLISFPCRSRMLERRMRRDLERDFRRYPETRGLQKVDQPHELYRQKLRVMIWRLDRTAEGARGAYSTPDEFVRDLELLEQLLTEHPSPRMARTGPGRLRVAAQVFGFHAARLDFRQHSSVVRSAVQELLRLSGLPAEPEAARIKSIKGLLESRSRLRNLGRLSKATRLTLEEFEALKEIQDRWGEPSASPYILSMTSRASDIWDVLLLAQRVGLVDARGSSTSPTALSLSKGDGHLHAAVDVVPLFETVKDLERCPEVLEELLSDPVYRRLLRSRRNFQEVMLGYSDSVKDAGYLAANLALFQAQKRLGEVAERHGVRLGLFHGKGGTIDRGGGQSYQSIQAQPWAAPEGRLRITEQGEVISLKYANPAIAKRNLEQLTAAILDAHLLQKKRRREAQLARWEEYAAELSKNSAQFYRHLVYESPDFLPYFRQATPIDLIEQLRLGSRPSRRFATSEAFDLKNLRAIPWVFAWTQSRQFVPSWYGVGWALEKFAADHSPQGADLLREMYEGWPFFRALIDNAEMSLAKTDLYIASRYAALVRPKSLGDSVFGRIKEEFERSVRQVLAVCGSPHLLARSPVLAESIRLRNPYVDPLNFLQTRFLERWRRSRKPERELLRLLQITVGGIAFGMKSTG